MRLPSAHDWISITGISGHRPIGEGKETSNDHGDCSRNLQGNTDTINVIDFEYT